MTQLNTPKPAINAPLDTENTLDTQELLFEVITSDTYTEVKEIEEWERKPEPRRVRPARKKLARNYSTSCLVICSTT